MVKPVLKWAGGKRQIISAILDHIPEKVENYFEPFIGGGAVFFALSEKQLISHSRISDINSDLFILYKVLKEEPEELHSAIRSLRFANNSEDYYQAREEFNRMDGKKHPAEKAALLIYLNRHCYNGLYRVNSRNEFNVPFGRYVHPSMPDKESIFAASVSLQFAAISNEDFESAVGGASEGDFVYLDPPYDPLSSTSRFTDYFSHPFGPDEQNRLSRTFRDLDRKGVRAMVSNSDTVLVRELYEGYSFTYVPAKRSINSKPSGRGKIRELLITNY